MKNKIALIASLILLVIGSAIAQPSEETDERISSMRAAFITDKLRLTVEESQAFWPIYNEHQEKIEQLKTSYQSAKQLDQMTEAEARQQIINHLDMEEALVKLKREYVQKLQQVIPSKKLARLPAAERAFKQRLIEEMQARRQERRGNLKRN